MRSLAEATRAMIRRLQELCGRRPARKPDEPEKRRLLEQVTNANEPASVPALIGVLCSGDPEISTAAAATVHQIVARCRPKQLAQLDEMARETAEWRYPPISTNEVFQLASGLTGTIGAMSFNVSGYVREAAVRLLGQVNDGEELAFLLIRLNDWVRPVRDAAKGAVTARIRPDYAPHFIRNLTLVFRLADQSRVAHQATLTAITRLLRSRECRGALRDAIGASDHDVRRIAYRVLIEDSGPDQLSVLHTALASEDPVLRLWAARELRSRLDGQALRDVLERLIADRFMPIRREALYGYIERLSESAESELVRSLLDPHPSMREAARFYLRQRGPAAFAEFYRQKLANAGEPQLATAVSGIGETGQSADGSLLVPYLTHSRTRVRRAATRAIGHLGTEKYIEPLIRALQDESPSVCRAAREILRSHVRQVGAQRLDSLLQGADKLHVQRAVLWLIADLQWWDSAPLLVQAAGSADEPVHEAALAHLSQWRLDYNRLSARPSRDQLGRLEDALKRNGGHLDHATLADIASLISYAKREIR